MTSIRRLPRLLAAAACAGLAAAAMAATGEQWEYTQTMEMGGMKMPMPPMKVCTRPGKDVVPPADKRCQLTDLRTSGDRTQWKVVCTGPNAMEGSGEATRKGDRLDAVMHMKSKEGEMTMTSLGRRLGPCTLPD
jgi:hypothetical protein